MENQFQNRRRNYFIKKRFQAKFIIKFCALVIISSLISGFIIYSMSKSTVTTTFENLRLTIKSTADFILPAVLLSSAVVIVSIGLVTIFITLFTSHKIAGPLYRMEKDVQEVTAGNLKTRFNLRQADEIKALAASLNIMAQTLHSRISHINEALSELESSAGLPDEAKDKLRKLKEAVSKFTV